MPSEYLLAPVSAGSADLADDEAVAAALVAVEVALAEAWADTGIAPRDAAEAIAAVDATLDAPALARAAVAGGNPVIPLVTLLRERAPESARVWVHHGATSQDVLDSALMLVAHRVAGRALHDLREIETALAGLAATHRDLVTVARTLTQHAVPTTVGARIAGWLSGVTRARMRLAATRAALPAQLGGAGGTLASFVQIGGADAARALPAAFAARLGLAAPEAPWHVTRWPVTELGDALVQTLDALGKVAADVATLSRTEIAELSQAAGGGSSAMPQKQNPTAAVLLRSAALRAPQLGATLHLAASLAVDERPDGAWHAEWPALRDLLVLAAGAADTARSLVTGLRVDTAAVAHHLAESGGLILAERLSLVLGADAAQRIVADVAAGASLEDAVGDDDLLDPAAYTGLAADIVDHAIAASEAS